MPALKLSVDAFVRDVIACGLLTAAEIEPLKAALPAGDAQADPTELARKLVAAGKLTKYQATNALQGKAKNLVFGDYVLVGKLGSGGMGDVFKAEHRRMKRFVALKVLPPAAVKSPDAVRRFQQEAQAAARLEHPNIVAAHDAGEGHGVHYLVMQYVDGRDLASLVAERGPLPVFKAVDYIVQAARGLAYAHDKGIVHRDVKPANLLLNNEGTVKILDMGIAKLATPLATAGTPSTDLTMSGNVMGTADFMSPEQAEDSHQADARSDIYSLGCTLYFLLTGEPPYRTATAVKTIVAHREQAIPSLVQKRSDVSPALDRLFARMVAKKPAERFQSMPEVIAALEPFAGGGTGVVNTAWAEPVRAQMDNPTSLTSSGANETVGSSTKGTSTLLESTVVKQTWSMTAKVIGGLFGTVIAPIAVAFILKYLDKGDTPPPPPNSAVAPAAGSPAAGTISPTQVASAGATVSSPSSVGAVPKPMPTLELVPGKSVDLSPLIDLDRDVVRGIWYIKDGVLRLHGTRTPRNTILRLPVEPPAEYDVSFTASRPKDGAGEAGLAIVFPIDGERGAVMMDGMMKRGHFWAIQEVDGKLPHENGTMVMDKPGFTDAPMPVRIKVRHDGVKVFAKGEPVFAWHGAPKQLSLPGGWNQVPRGHFLCLMSVADFDIGEIVLLPGGDDGIPLFNGADLNGWTSGDASHWRVNVKSKTLTGVSDKQPFWIFTERDYGEMRLSMEFKLAPDSNSGLAVRASPTDKEPEHLQIELRNDIEPTANLAAGTLLNGGVAKNRHLAPLATPTLKEAAEWNDLDLDLHNQRLRVWINGVEVQNVDLSRHGNAKRAAPSLKRTSGRIGLQILAGKVQFRNIAISDGQP